jgi:hypothetical protein
VDLTNVNEPEGSTDLITLGKLASKQQTKLAIDTYALAGLQMDL